MLCPRWLIVICVGDECIQYPFRPHNHISRPHNHIPLSWQSKNNYTHTGVKILQKKDMLRMIWKKRVCAGGDVAVLHVFKRTDIQQSTFMTGPNKKAK